MIHIIPTNDRTKHTPARDCECKPTIEAWGGKYGPVCVHRAADGREERGHGWRGGGPGWYWKHEPNGETK